MRCAYVRPVAICQSVHAQIGHKLRLKHKLISANRAAACSCWQPALVHLAVDQVSTSRQALQCCMVLVFTPALQPLVRGAGFTGHLCGRCLASQELTQLARLVVRAVSMNTSIVLNAYPVNIRGVNKTSACCFCHRASDTACCYRHVPWKAPLCCSSRFDSFKGPHRPLVVHTNTNPTAEAPGQQQHGRHGPNRPGGAAREAGQNQGADASRP
jgi:hypothetical protein